MNPSLSPKLLSPNAYQQIDREIAKYPANQRQSAVMATLAIAQVERGFVSTDVMEEIAQYLNMPAIAVQEVATFYNMYNLKPIGKFKITVCTNLPCALSGGTDTAAYLKRKLGVGFNETTQDGLFTLKEGECMGACGDAPVLMLNNHQMCSFMSHEKIDALLESLRQNAKEAKANVGAISSFQATSVGVAP